MKNSIGIIKQIIPNDGEPLTLIIYLKVYPNIIILMQLL